MNTPHLNNTRGSALISAAIASGILSIVIASFITFLTNEYILNFRSHRWTQSLHLAEGGIEIAFAELNYPFYRNNSPFQSAAGWVAGGTAGTYTMTVSNLTSTTGEAVGDVTITVTGATTGSAYPKVQAVGTCKTWPHGPLTSRAILATLAISSQFPVGLMSKNRMDMNGNNIYTDSYDSTDVSKSTSGLYDATKKQANGSVASNGTVTNSFSIGNADIYGNAYTGIGGSVALGSGGSIGPTFVVADRATTVAAAVSKGWLRSDFNVDVPDVTLPAGATSWPYAVGGSHSIAKDETLTSGDYRIDNISLTSSERKDTLLITGNVRLYITGNVNLSGTSQIVVTNGASLKVYINGNVSLGGNGVINNAVTPINNQWYSTASAATTWSISGNGRWIGTVYAPKGNMTMNGGGSSGDMSGGIVANNITLNGQVQFHYDESLRNSDTGAGYTVQSWQELRYVSGAWVP